MKASFSRPRQAQKRDWRGGAIRVLRREGRREGKEERRTGKAAW